MRQNIHNEKFWLMCNWVGGFGFGFHIGVHNFKFLETDWIWSLWKNFGCNPISKFPYPYTRGGQKAEFGLCGGRLRLFIADAESKKFLCRRRRRSFFLNFLCTFETHDCFNFSCKVSWRIRFADTAFSFSMVKSLVLHLVLLNVYKI